MANKFNPQGRSKYLWVPDLADPTAPTVDELDTSDPLNDIIDLTCGITPDGVTGFSNAPTTVDATTLCSIAEETVPGLPSTEDGAFTMARGSTASSANSQLMDDLLALRDENAEGYIVFVPDGWNENATPAETGPDVGDIVDVFPVEIASVNANPAAGGAMATYSVGFSHPGQFVLNAKVAAA